MSFEQSRYALSLDLNVLNHLGLNLYSNTAAALSEAVANAWDADATEVRIALLDDEITIIDNGVGMTLADVNDKFLKVGYRRRGDAEDQTLQEQGKATEERTPGGRAVMGRKGIGKLALFSISEDITVLTRRADDVPEGFTMTVSAIREAIRQGEDYHPTEITPPIDLPIGTALYLRELKARSLSNTRAALRRRLARRFAVIGTPEFNVVINDEPVTFRDRDDLKAVQFLWQIGQPLQQNPQYAQVDLTDTRQFPRFFVTADSHSTVVNPTLNTW